MMEKMKLKKIPKRKRCYYRNLMDYRKKNEGIKKKYHIKYLNYLIQMDLYIFFQNLCGYIPYTVNHFTLKLY